MPSKRPRYKRPLRLHEIVEELENGEDDVPIPSSIAILPPENANADVADEDSGEEDNVTLHNLPGTQLRAEAETQYSDSSDDDDNIPLSDLLKVRRTESDDSPNTAKSSAVHVSVTRCNITQPTVQKTQKYTWQNHHTPKKFEDWRDDQAPRYLQPPMFYFDLMFDEKVFDMLVHYTNIYAAQRNRAGNVSVSEMKCFIGILLFSGYVVVPRRSMYWEKSTDSDYPLIYNALSRDRFNFIMSHLHSCDNTQICVSNDKISKLRLLFDFLNNNFLGMAPLEENYSIDEAMVPYYGGHSCKQFIRGKPIRWGYKLRVGATRLGYVLWFDPYQGHSTTLPPPYKQFGLGGSVILQFADVLQSHQPNLHFHLYFDNFFTSIPLLHELSNRGLRATGTIRENRTSKCPLPSNATFKKTERGTFEFKSSSPASILVCKWNDNSVVTVTSNVENVEPLHKAKRFSQEQKKYINIDQPFLVKKYNENMGGVDRSDQNIGLYRTSIRGKKWYFPLFCHCLDMALHNAWQLYKHNGGGYDHLNFRRVVARGLLETYKKKEKRGPCPSPRSHMETSRYDRIDHLIMYKDTQLTCKVCKKKTNFICKKCETYLHPKVCFITYHTPS